MVIPSFQYYDMLSLYLNSIMYIFVSDFMSCTYQKCFMCSYRFIWIEILMPIPVLIFETNSLIVLPKSSHIFL